MISYLKFFTWLNEPEILALENPTKEHPEKRDAQRTLAQEITRAVHGETELS